MDDKWFKLQQKKAGVTADDIAKHIGRDRSVVSKIYSGQRTMSLEWANAFSEVLRVPLADVLERAGAMDAPTAQKLQPGFAESDAAPWKGKDAENRSVSKFADALGARPGIDIWLVKSAAMSLAGYLPDDYILLDTHQAERVRPGDIVIAQIYNNASGTATTVLRRFQPPVLVSASCDPADQAVHVVDGINVVIRGKVSASWRV